MEYIKNTTEFYIPQETAVSLGKFDGVHRGHGRLLEYLREKQKQGLKSVAFTFDIPPSQEILAKETGKALSTREERAYLLERAGADYVLECPFTPEMRRMEPEEFVKMLVVRLHPRCFAVGTDFRFGYQRRGDYRLLQELSGQYGYEVAVIEKEREGGRDISSTQIRAEVAAGRIDRAGLLLGHPYFVRGKVCHGNEIGRKIGVPTANLLPPAEKLLPPFGVYAARATIEGREGEAYPGITNVGKKPTIEGIHPAGVETHLFDFSEDIYGKIICVEFYALERLERKFDSLEELKRQLFKDIEFGRRYFRENEGVMARRRAQEPGMR